MTRNGVATRGTLDDLKAVRIRSIWRFVKRQPLSFWLVCTYLFFEYVRPQQVYPEIDVLPWPQIVLILATGAVFLERRKLRFPTVVAPLLAAYTGWVLLTSVTAYDPGAAFGNLKVYLTWVLVFFLITNVITTGGRVFVFLLLFLFCSFKMSQHGARSWISIGFGFRGWGATGGPGWFHNSGEFGIQMCVFLPMSVAFIWALKDRWSRWKLALFALMPITAVMSIIASSSRGALLGLAALALWWLVFVSRRVKAAAVTAVLAAGVYLAIPAQQMERLENMGDDRTSESRLERWEDGVDIANAYPIFGVGYANWLEYYPDHYPAEWGSGLSHNIFVDAWAELGYPGLLAFLLLIWGTLRVNADTRRLARAPPEEDRFLYAMAYGLDGALVGFLATGFFVSVLYYPYFWINLALVVSLNVSARKRARIATDSKAESQKPVLRSLAVQHAGSSRHRESKHRDEVSA